MVSKDNVLLISARAIFVSLDEALFANFFINGLVGLGLPKSDIAASLARGVKTITEGLSGELKTAVLNTLNDSLVHAWRLPVVLCCLGIIGALAIEHRKVRGAGLGLASKPEE
jgi:predicted outer membrane lipoprotein